MTRRSARGDRRGSGMGQASRFGDMYVLQPIGNGLLGCILLLPMRLTGMLPSGSRPRTGGGDRQGEYENVTLLNGLHAGGTGGTGAATSQAAGDYPGRGGECREGRPGRAVPAGPEARRSLRPQPGRPARTRPRPGTRTAAGSWCRPGRAGRRRVPLVSGEPRTGPVPWSLESRTPTLPPGPRPPHPLERDLHAPAVVAAFCPFNTPEVLPSAHAEMSTFIRSNTYAQS
jgi:hypothetical protein